MLPERFWTLVDKSGGCWVWKGAFGPRGYGRFQIAGVRKMAHRWAYEDLVGPLPLGLEFDHLCRNHNCVNPAHLEPVTHAENMRRAVYGARRNQEMAKTHCVRGHDLSLAVLRMHHGKMERRCVFCERERARAYRAHRAAQRERRGPASRTHCPKGHPYDEVHTYYNPDGSRTCRQCHRERQRERHRRLARQRRERREQDHE